MSKRFLTTRDVAHVCFITAYVMMFIIFFAAYSCPAKVVVFTINTYGEATIEAILILLSLPSVLVYVCKGMFVIEEEETDS